jgi:hypothetical protein
MLSAKVVVHEVERNCVLVILDPLGVRVGQSRQATDVHSHRKVLPFGVGR